MRDLCTLLSFVRLQRLHLTAVTVLVFSYLLNLCGRIIFLSAEDPAEESPSQGCPVRLVIFPGFADHAFVLRPEHRDERVRAGSPASHHVSPGRLCVSL
jgi:hypothetical protein